MEFEQVIDNVTKVHNKRMTRKNKLDFRNFILKYCDEKNYTVSIEKSAFSNNIVINNVSSCKHLIVAHYDTPPRMPRFFINHQILCMVVFLLLFMLILFLGKVWIMFGLVIVIIAMEFYLLGFLKGSNKFNFNDNSSGVLAVLKIMNNLENSDKKNDYAFVLFDNEEKGLLGSMVFAKNNRNKLMGKNIINLDCIGTGTNINIYAFNTVLAYKLQEAIKVEEDYTVRVQKPSFLKMSDHHSFKQRTSVMISAEFKKGKKFYMKNIHSKFDKKLDLNNLNMICDGILKL